jgi:hypothetical protein
MYAKGQAFDATGLVVAKTYSDGTERVLESSEYEVNPPDTSVLGEKKVIVTRGTYSAVFTIKVETLSLQSIALTSLPAKTYMSWGKTWI